MKSDQLDLLGEPPLPHKGAKRKDRVAIERAEAQDAVNDLFRRAMQGDAKAWLKGLLTFVGHMRRYSIFTAKLVYIQRPGAIAVGTSKYWAGHGRTIRPGAIPIVILVPNGPISLVYEVEDTEQHARQLGFDSLDAPRLQVISEHDWQKFRRNVELFGTTAKRRTGLFRIQEKALGTARHGDVHHARDRYDRFIIRLNKSKAIDARFLTLVHEVAHVFCGHTGSHPLGWWQDRRRLHGIKSREMEDDIMEFEAEAVAWIIAKRAGLLSDAPDYLADRIAPLDNERIDMNAVLDAANRIETLMG